MALTRRLHALLVGCVIFGMVVFAGTPHTAAQSRPSKPASSRAGAANSKSTPRPDVERFRQRAEAALSAAGPDKGAWGVLVTDATTGEDLYARNAGGYFMPASNAKLFTTALALATLGPDYRVRTTVASSSTLDANGVLNGDLVLIGRGDANLSNRKFPYGKKEERDGPPEKVLAEFADAVAARGVKEVAGDVIADDSMFQHEKFPSGWLVDDILWSYGAAVSAIAVNDNTFSLEVRHAANEGEPARYEAGLAADFYTVENSIRTGARGSEEKLAVARDPGSRVIHLSGTMPLDAQTRRLTIAIEDPAEFAADLLARLLEARGVKIDGSARARHAGGPPVDAAAPQTVLAEHTSIPLSEEVRLTNKNSENLHAELLLLLAAHEKAGARNYEDALKFASDYFKTSGIAEGDVVLSDGSGLSRKDLVTPRALVQLLRYAATQPWGELYRSTLPVAGEDGTLSDRMKDTPAASRVFAKTGTIGHGNALSGYATTIRGERLLFSILGNNNNLHAQDANKVIDAICVAMVEELGPSPQTKKRK
ncbi:MAG TPA: D-alanyl-D-alanine carboxypeptidase/D-alanyl-D-alanine-endopeptidase [Candidatus Acidoferrales bacterium]|nr:D-alanyl-D-alanine carboxypeptidase/D-alanyl-D-alanine-endopeptidase [Candidatus Acidoferrales bacterium]